MTGAVLTTAATSRLEFLLRRIYSLTVIASSVEVVANALSQSDLLNGLQWLFLGIFAASVLAPGISSWFGEGKDLWFWIHGVVSMLTMLLWPWMVLDANDLPAEYQPWIWWGVGMAAISIGIVAQLKVAFAYLIGNSVIWFLIDTSPFGGASNLFVSVQDSIYIFLFSGAVIGLINLVREGSRQADQANSEAIGSAIQQAQIDAVERERQRMDALVHDRVLNTLLLASKATDIPNQLAAAESASVAIESLRQAEEDPETQGTVTPLGLFRALKRAAIRLVPEVSVESNSGGTEEIPAYVAQALTEATLQALDNAARHSRAKKIILKMDAPAPAEIAISVVDDGVGFKLDRISRDRIGIKTSIFARLDSIGGGASVNTEPGKGTKIVLRWSE